MFNISALAGKYMHPIAPVLHPLYFLFITCSFDKEWKDSDAWGGIWGQRKGITEDEMVDVSSIYGYGV